jgi:hypothetical protein
LGQYGCSSAPGDSSSRTSKQEIGETDEFGFSVSISEDTIVVGAPAEASLTGEEDDDSKFGVGAVYICEEWNPVDSTKIPQKSHAS